MDDVKANEVKSLFTRFLAARNEEWIASYSAAVDWAQSASEQEFRSPRFQQRLWEVEGVTGIGPGDSVTVPGAYTDEEVSTRFGLFEVAMCLRKRSIGHECGTRHSGGS